MQRCLSSRAERVDVKLLPLWPSGTEISPPNYPTNLHNFARMAILRRLNERFACFSGRLVDEAIKQDFAEPLRPLCGSLFVDLALDGDEFHGGSTGPIIDD